MHPLSLEPKPQTREHNWAAWRRPETALDRELQPETLAWLVTLPERARPYALAQRFPRIANRIASCVHEPVKLERTMDSLLVDHRGNRQGFPEPVLRDLMNLHQHFQTARLYQAQRRRLETKAESRRASRYADIELVHEREAAPLARARRHAPAPRHPGILARIFASLRPAQR